MSELKEARFPVLVLAITMLAPVVLAIGLVLWKTSRDEVEARRPKSSRIHEEVPEGHIRLTLTVPGMMAGQVKVSRLDSDGNRGQSAFLPVKSAVGSADLELGSPPLELLLEAEGYETRRLSVNLKRTTSTLELIEDEDPDVSDR